MDVLMLHGAGGGAWEWTVWRRVFEAAGHRVHAPDLMPDAGGLAATGLDHYRAQALQAAQHLAAPYAAIGASLGGLLALDVASSTRCAALVMANPLPPQPEARRLPPRAPYPRIIPWGSGASLPGTRRALPDADDAACVFAFRRWRNESGRVLNEARAGVSIAPPRCPILVLASDSDDDVPAAVSAALASRLSATLLRVPGSHVGPVLGRAAAGCARMAVDWLNSRVEFTGD